MLVLHQYRHPAAMRLVELPAGLLDVEGEDPLAAAKRELQEEGLVLAAPVDASDDQYSSPGLSSERVRVLPRRGADAGAGPRRLRAAHEEADMTLEWVPLDDLVEAVRAGRVSDAPTAQAVTRLRPVRPMTSAGRRRQYAIR